MNKSIPVEKVSYIRKNYVKIGDEDYRKIQSLVRLKLDRSWNILINRFLLYMGYTKQSQWEYACEKALHNLSQ